MDISFKSFIPRLQNLVFKKNSVCECKILSVPNCIFITNLGKAKTGRNISAHVCILYVSLWIFIKRSESNHWIHNWLFFGANPIQDGYHQQLKENTKNGNDFTEIKLIFHVFLAESFITHIWRAAFWNIAWDCA